MSFYPWNRLARRQAQRARRLFQTRRSRQFVRVEDLEARTLLSRVWDLNSAATSPDDFVAAGSGIYFTMTSPFDGTDLFFVENAATARPAQLIANFPRSTRSGADLPRPDLDSAFRTSFTEGQVPSISYLTPFNGALYFAAEDAAGGNELWRTDGTAAGTVRVADINPGAAHSNPEGLMVYNNQLYFSANNGTHGRELWRTNGTTAGTVRVTDINPGAGNSDPVMMTEVYALGQSQSPTLIFGARFNNTQAHALYRYNGTTVTQISATGATGPLFINQYAVSGFASPGKTPRRLEFPTISASGGKVAVLTAGPLLSGFQNSYNLELWATDGSQNGTKLLRDFSGSSNEGSAISGMVKTTDNFVYFKVVIGGATYLYRSNGVNNAGIVNVGPNGGQPIIAAGVNSITATDVTAAGTRVYYTVANSQNGATELWSTTGPNATAFVAPITPPIDTRADAQWSPSLFAGRSDGVLFFTNVDINGTGAELWQSGGTPQTTVLIQDINPGNESSSPRNLTVINNDVYFAATSNGWLIDLWRSRGAGSGAQRVASEFRVPKPNGGTVARQTPTLTESSNPQEAVLYKDMVLFIASDGIVGSELFRTQVDSSGAVTTTRVKDIRPGGSAQPMSLTVYNGYVYFLVPGNDSVAGLWRTDGTNAGTVQLFATTQISLQAPDLVVSQNRLFFSVYNSSVISHVSQLWMTDGQTVAFVKEFNPVVVGTIPQDNPISELVATNNRLYFVADDGLGREPWVVAVNNGQPTVVLLKNINTFNNGTGNSNPSNFTAVGNTIYFTADDGTNGRELWSSTGTEAGTVRYDLLAGPSGSNPHSLINGGGTLYFAVANSTSSTADDAIYSATPASGAPQKLADVINPGQLMYVNSTLVFAADSAAVGRELWRYKNGSASLLKDINAGSGNGMVGDYGSVVVDGVLYFAARTEYDRTDHVGRVASGIELYRSDGTPEGTYPAHDIFVGDGSSYPRPLLAIPDSSVGLPSGILLSADDGLRGRELHYIPAQGPANDLTGDGKSDYSQYHTQATGVGEWYTVENRGDASAYDYDYGRQWGAAADVTLTGDYDGDGRDDLVAWRPSTGQWFVKSATGSMIHNGVVWGQAGDIPMVIDYDGDGRDDLAVWRASANGTWIVRLSSNGQTAQEQWGAPADIPLVGDFDGDGRDDIVAWGRASGRWFVKKTGVGSPIIILGQAWGVTGDTPVTGDFDGDGRDDFGIVRSSHSSDIREARWYVMLNGVNNNRPIQHNGTLLGQTGDLPVVGDYNRDGRDDLALWRPSTGQWFVKSAIEPGPTMILNGTLWGEPGDLPQAGDYNGDGINDLAVWRTSTGEWHIHLKNSPSPSIHTQLGLPADLPVPGDYDGDGRSDYALYRAVDTTTGGTAGVSSWYIGLNRGNGIAVIPVLAANGKAIAFGRSGDIPVPGDYNGDGRNDLAVYRPSTKRFYVRILTVTQQANGSYVAQAGPEEVIDPANGANLGNIQPAIGDFNGDGRDDFAVFERGSNGLGTWHIRLNLTNGTRPYFARQWGLAGDIPVPGDFNGDGRDDLVVYRPNDPVFGGAVAGWYIEYNLRGQDPNTISRFAHFDNDPNTPGIQPLGLGITGDEPIAADMNGDGRDDFVVHRPADRQQTGFWVVTAWYGALVGRTGSDIRQGPTYDWGRSLGLPTDTVLGSRPLRAAGGPGTATGASSSGFGTTAMASSQIATTAAATAPSTTGASTTHVARSARFSSNSGAASKFAGIGLGITPSSTPFDPFSLLRKRRLKGV